MGGSISNQCTPCDRCDAPGGLALPPNGGHGASLTRHLVPGARFRLNRRPATFAPPPEGVGGRILRRGGPRRRCGCRHRRKKSPDPVSPRIVSPEPDQLRQSRIVSPEPRIVSPEPRIVSPEPEEDHAADRARPPIADAHDRVRGPSRWRSATGWWRSPRRTWPPERRHGASLTYHLTTRAQFWARPPDPPRSGHHWGRVRSGDESRGPG
jgi:hypothetical protein